MANQPNTHPAAVQISATVLRARYEQDKTLVELGRQAGVSHVTVSELEKNKGGLLNTAAAILDALGYDLIAVKRVTK